MRVLKIILSSAVLLVMAGVAMIEMEWQCQRERRLSD